MLTMFNHLWSKIRLANQLSDQVIRIGSFFAILCPLAYSNLHLYNGREIQHFFSRRVVVSMYRQFSAIYQWRVDLCRFENKFRMLGWTASLWWTWLLQYISLFFIWLIGAICFLILWYSGCLINSESAPANLSNSPCKKLGLVSM